MKDFFNGDNPMQHASFFQFLSNATEEIADLEDAVPGASNQMYFDAGDVLSVAASFIRRGGYISVEKAEENLLMSTSQLIRSVFLGSSEWPEIKEIDKEKARNTLEWLVSDAALQSGAKSEYIHNITTLAKAGQIKKNYLGIFGSAITAFDRALARSADDKLTSTSRFIGTMNQKLEITEVTIVAKIFIPPGMYGSKTLYIMKDESGNRLSWFNSGKEIGIVGDRLHISGTVDKHEQYNGVDQTQLKRVTSLEEKLYDMIESSKGVKHIAKLIADPINLDHVNIRSGMSAVMKASLDGNSEVVELLLRHGASPDVQSNDGETAAHFAAAQGNIKCVRILEEWGADMNKQSKERLSIVQLLSDAQETLLSRTRFQVQQSKRPELAELKQEHWESDPFFPLSALGKKKDWEAYAAAARALAEMNNDFYRPPKESAVLYDDGTDIHIIAGHLLVSEAFCAKASHVDAVVVHKAPVQLAKYCSDIEYIETAKKPRSSARP